MKTNGQKPVRPDSDVAPIKAWFLGPKAENTEEFKDLIGHIIDLYEGWRTNYCPEDRKLVSSPDKEANQRIYGKLKDDLDELIGKLTFEFPFFSPRYIGHMLSDQSMPAMLGYFAAMLRNANNVTTEAASVTSGLELDVSKAVAAMVGFDPKQGWAHICSGGTIANLEALWAARAVQLLPLCLKELCSFEEAQLRIEVLNPNGTSSKLAKTPNATLLAMKPSDALALGAEVKSALSKKLSPEWFRRSLATSKFNPRTKGVYAVYKKLGLHPVILVSRAAHYSISKAAQILGYGEDSVHQLPVDSRFRIDIDALSKALSGLRPTQYVAAVIGIVGTTEEGAVDPIHDIVGLRTGLERTNNRSFWLHLDAAWGGYFASIFNAVSSDAEAKWERPSIEATVATDPLPSVFADPEDRTVKWDDPDVLSAYDHMKEPDSVTIDPHKTGYIPYPAGMILFRDGRLKELLTQRAQYITAKADPAKRNLQENIGPYIVEGSKPGAAAAACWLAHKAIPLNNTGHGLLMKDCVLSAQRLMLYLKQHKLLYDFFEQDYTPQDRASSLFTFVPISGPDTNVVAFVAVSAIKKDGVLVPALETIGRGLVWLWKVNKAIHERLTISVFTDRKETIFDKKFFISHTEFTHEEYAESSLAMLLKSIDAKPDDYVDHDLYVLRATVMNPFYGCSTEQKDILFEFVKHLHGVARDAFRVP
jgi:glutamate/tyrosine decarboxylase-like PLP-dependent enzyme